MAGGYFGGGTHEAENKRRVERLVKPNYFEKDFAKNNHERSAIPHLNTEANPEQLAQLKKQLKKEKIKSVLLYFLSLLLTVGVLYLLYYWLNQ